MDALLAQVEAVLTKEILIGLTIASVVFFVGTLIAIPFILVRLPPHYFDERHPRLWMPDHHPGLRLLGFIVKNAVGAVLLAVGIALLVLPGQGILTILLGVSLLDFPGKRYIERKIVGQPTVLKAINALREKYAKPPLSMAGDL
ncbi:MAG: PGPGW domain-containing protein [Nitrospirota bacterium]